jgi:hypothetical protein
MSQAPSIRARSRVVLPLALLMLSLAGAACERRSAPEIPPPSPAGGNSPTTPTPPASSASM